MYHRHEKKKKYTNQEINHLKYALMFSRLRDMTFANNNKKSK